MDLTQNVEAMGLRDFHQSNQLVLLERGDDQQDRVGAIGLRFQYLKFIDDEVLAQAGKRTARRGFAQVIERSLKKLLVRQHRKRGRPGLLKFCRKLSRPEFFANQSPRGRRLFEFSDDCNSIVRSPAELVSKSARGVLGGRTLQFSQPGTLPAAADALG